MNKDVIFSEKEGTLTAKLECDIDHHTAKPMRQKIDKRLSESAPRALILDFSAVGFMDSSGLGLILGRVERASEIGATVYLVGLSPTLMKLVRLSGIERIRNLSLIK